MAKTEKDETQLQLARQLNHVPWCEQYERMISGMLYDSLTPELTQARFKARRFAHNYNNYFPQDATADSLTQDRLKMLKDIIGYIADDEAFIEPPFHIDYGCNISLGKRFYSNFHFTVLDCGLVMIGDRVMMGPNVSIYAATHEVEVQSRRDNIEYAKTVVIGDDCWIGGHVVILPGIEIGKGTTVASGSVVSKSLPAWSVCMGTPAKIVKKVTPLES